MPNRNVTIIPPPDKTGHVHLYDFRALTSVATTRKRSIRSVSSMGLRCGKKDFLMSNLQNIMDLVRLCSLALSLAKCEYCEKQRAIFTDQKATAKKRTRAWVNGILFCHSVGEISAAQWDPNVRAGIL